MSKQTITITLKNGIIQDIKGLPDNIRIQVLDFDIDGVDEDKLIKLPDNGKAFEEIWIKNNGIIYQDNRNEEKLSKCIPSNCPECGYARSNYDCHGLQYTYTDIQSVDDKNNGLIPSSLDMADWSVSPVLIYCGKCGLLLLDRRLEVAKAISIWDKG